MKHMNSADRLRMLSCIPRNMVKMQGADNVSEFVLHHLSCKDCFNLRKAAYFIDNPAFNCLKGVVGYDQDEAYNAPLSIWEDQAGFSNHMQSALFNQKVRNCVQYSCKSCETPDEQVLKVIADDLGMDSFRYCTWNMKHDNHGYLLYQPNECEIEVEELLNGLSLLSFCPIF